MQRKNANQTDLVPKFVRKVTDYMAYCQFDPRTKKATLNAAYIYTQGFAQGYSMGKALSE